MRKTLRTDDDLLLRMSALASTLFFIGCSPENILDNNGSSITSLSSTNTPSCFRQSYLSIYCD